MDVDDERMVPAARNGGGGADRGVLDFHIQSPKAMNRHDVSFLMFVPFAERSRGDALPRSIYKYTLLLT